MPRCARVVADVAWLAERYSFPGLQALAEVTASREDATGQITTRRRLFVLSRPVTADALLATVRSHWGIENQLHWVMDVVFDEDRSRARTDNAPLNLAVLRRIALNLAKANTSKGSVRGKITEARSQRQDHRGQDQESRMGHAFLAAPSSKCDSPRGAALRSDTTSG